MNRIQSTLLALSLLLPATVFGQLQTGNDKGVSMGHLHFRVADVDAHKKLLTQALGAKVLHAGPLEVYALPGVDILLAKGEPSGGNEGTVVNHLGFKVKNLEEMKDKLTACGARIMSENPKTRQMFALFPDNIKVEITEDKMLDQPVVHDHIHFATPQIEEQRAWYEKTFGAKLGISRGFKAAELPGVTLRWLPADHRLPGIKGTSVDHIGFEVAHLEQFCKELEEQGVKFDVPFRSVKAAGLNIAFLTDPWGVNIELTEGLSALEEK